MNSEKFIFESGLNYSIFHIKTPTQRTEPFLVPFPCLILCTQGSATIEYNMETFTLCKDSIFCAMSGTTLKGVEMSFDFEGIVILFANEVLHETTSGFKAEYFASVFSQPHKQITDLHMKRIIQNLFHALDSYHEIDDKFNRSTDFVYNIIRSLIITLAEMSQSVITKDAYLNQAFSSTDNYFKEFLQLLSLHSKTQHNVAFYADKLCITPKYLNEICRKKAKLTAKEVITRSVIAQIKSALIVSGSSVQRIAYDFNFSDQSSFGKYFKKSVGMAPLAFRNKHNGTPEE